MTYTGPNRRVERINDTRMDRLYQTFRLLDAYTNPLRHGLPLSSTEQNVVKHAAKVLMGRA